MVEKADHGLDASIADKLAMLNVNLDDLDDRTMDQLRKIESAVIREEEALEKARAILRGKGFSISSISAASGVSRATFYNKPLLADYLELRKKDAMGDEPEATVRKAELDEAKEKITKLMESDGELVLSLADNERLSKRIEALEAVLRDMQSHRVGMPSARPNAIAITKDGDRG